VRQQRPHRGAGQLEILATVRAIDAVCQAHPLNTMAKSGNAVGDVALVLPAVFRLPRYRYSASNLIDTADVQNRTMGQ